jgi:PAS domain S-box-containing protein
MTVALGGRTASKKAIARRLLVGLTATVGLSSALVVALLGIYETRAGDRDLKADLDGSIAAFAQMIEPALWDIDSARTNRLAEAFARDPRIARLTVREATTGQTTVIEPLHTPDTAVRTRQVRRGDTVLGDVSIAFDRNYYHRVVVQQLVGAVGVLLIALFATLVAFQLLFRRILLRPLDDLSALVREYGENAYQPRGIDLPYVEFDGLARVLEAMSRQIREHFDALGAANRELQALNRFLMNASADVDPRELVAEAARELKDLFDAAAVRAEIAPDHGPAEAVIVDRGDSGDHASAQVALEVPIVVGRARTGAIILRRESARPFTAAEVTLANAVGAQVGAAVSRYRSRAGERLLRTAIEQLPDSVVITDSAMRAVYVNPAFSAVTGYSHDEALGRIPRDLKRAIPSDPKDDDVLARVASGETFVGRLRGRRKSGDIFHEDTVITAVRDESGAITNHVSVSRDVTLEMEREERYRHAQRMDAIGQLAGGVAHDFNNMLAIVMIQLDLLERELQLTPDQTDSMQNMRDALDRAANLTRQLLMFSRRQAMRVEEHDLDVIVEQMLRILRRVIGEEIHVEFTPSSTPVAFEGDAGMIEQVIVNLCVNARDAMPDGGRLNLSTGVATFDDGAEHPGRWARLSVADTGTGMSEEVQRRIFEPFFTTKDVGHGTGLGLATTHGIIAQHDGWIQVESEVGKGTTFHVYLPALSHVPAQQMYNPTRSARTAAARVLVVEDEEVVRHIVTRSLRQLGHEVIEASSGPEAIQLWLREDQGRRVDLVLTDMVMPHGMTGVELIEELRRTAPGFRAIVMSGYSLQLAGDALPADISLLPKPFSLEALNKCVAEALR